MPRCLPSFARRAAAAICVGTLLCVMPAVAQRPRDARPAPRRPAPGQSEPSLAETADWLKRWLPQIGGMTHTTVTRGPQGDATSVDMVSILSAELDQCVLSIDSDITTKFDGESHRPSHFRSAVALDALDPNTIVLKNLTSFPPTLPTLAESAWWTVSVAARGASKPVRKTSSEIPGETFWHDTLGFAVQDEIAGRRVKSALARALTLCTPTSRKEPF